MGWLTKTPASGRINRIIFFNATAPFPRYLVVLMNLNSNGVGRLANNSSSLSANHEFSKRDSSHTSSVLAISLLQSVRLRSILALPGGITIPAALPDHGGRREYSKRGKGP